MTYIPPDLPDGYEFKEKGFWGTAFSPVIEFWYGWWASRAAWDVRTAEYLQRSEKEIARKKTKRDRLQARHRDWALWLMAYEEANQNHENNQN